jgi:bifunctional non-homologous end joining protein LigD
VVEQRVRVVVDGRELQLSNLDKVLYPQAAFTKAEVIDYYTRIAPAVLPHLTGRPVTLKRYPNGVDGQFFFEKNAPSHTPDWVRTERLPVPGSTMNRDEIDYVLCEERATLVWLANLAALELHVPQWCVRGSASPNPPRGEFRTGGAASPAPQHGRSRTGGAASPDPQHGRSRTGGAASPDPQGGRSRTGRGASPDPRGGGGGARGPDLLVFDLDPGAPASIVDCCEVACLLREQIAAEGLTGYPKTSGRKGMQVYAPIAESTDERTSAYAKGLAERLERSHPRLVVSRMAKALRPGKVLLDWSQNNAAKTTVAPYSLRAAEQPTVSAPVTWQEVESGRPLRFLTGEVLERYEKFGDLFDGLRTGDRPRLPG